MRVNWRPSALIALIAALAIAAVPLSASSEMLPPVGSTVGELAGAPLAAPASAPAAERPAWQMLPLTDARTGQTFTLADFAGKTVYVEPMATWCTNCRQQLSLIRDQVRAQVDSNQVVFVALSVETNLASETLASYAVTHGFDWTFAVMTPELLQELATTFGRTVANPPAVPHFVIGPDGTTSDLSTGFQTAERLLERLDAASMAMP